MLSLGKLQLLLVSILLFGCIDTVRNKSQLFLEQSSQAIGKEVYIKIFNGIQDSLNLWVLNKLSDYEAEIFYDYQLDSLICFSHSRDKSIGCIHIFGSQNGSTTDNLQFLYGEKIQGNWYFFRGATVLVPRELFKNQNIHTPLTYEQLHKRALQDVFSPYLIGDEINEAWFTSHFEHVGWGDIRNQEYDDWCFKGKCYTNIHEYYQACHLCKVKANWASRDTTQPIKQLPKKELQ